MNQEPIAMKTTDPTITCLEPFTFRDGGVRLAWVTWRIRNGERACIGVREYAPAA